MVKKKAKELYESILYDDYKPTEHEIKEITKRLIQINNITKMEIIDFGK